MKRTLYIVISVVVVVVLGLLAFWFIGKNNSGTTGTGTSGSLPGVGIQTGTGTGTTGTTGGTNTGGGTTGGLSATSGTTGSGASAQFGVITNEPVLDYFVDAQNNVTIAEPNGEIASILNAQPTFLSSSPIQGIISASFSYDGKKILVNFGDPTNPQTSIFDLASKAWTPLPVGIISPVWSPSDYRIAYLQVVSGATSLVTLDISKTTNKPVVVSGINIQNALLAWPNKTQIAINDKPSSYFQGSSWIFNISGKTFSAAASSSYGLETIWSGTTSSVGLAFISGTNGQGGQLSLINSSDMSSQNMTLFTLPSKCVFATSSVAATVSTTPPTTSSSATSTSKTKTAPTSTPAAPAWHLVLYCAVPRSTSALGIARIPDDYNKEALFTDDDFYKVDTQTGSSTVTFLPAGGFDGTDLKTFNNTLFFVNRYDQKLYAISLGQ